MPFRDGEIGRAELEGEETRLHRAAVLVSHSVDVATPNYPILYPPPCTQAALPDSAKPSFFKKRALHPRERAQRKQIRAIPLISYYRV